MDLDLKSLILLVSSKICFQNQINVTFFVTFVPFRIDDENWRQEEVKETGFILKTVT